MTVEALLRLIRKSLDDEVEPYGWSDDYLIDALSRAEEEAAERASLLRDDTTDSVTLLTYAADQNTIQLNPLIAYVERAAVVGSNSNMIFASKNGLSHQLGYWENQVANKPVYFIREGTTVTLCPKPVLEGQIRLTVLRKPLNKLVNLSQEPEIDPAYHRDLIYFVLAEAYSHLDVDSRNVELSEMAAKRFDGVFGRRKSARFTRMNQDHVKNSGVYMRQF